MSQALIIILVFAYIVGAIRTAQSVYISDRLSGDEVSSPQYKIALIFYAVFWFIPISIDLVSAWRAGR